MRFCHCTAYLTNPGGKCCMDLHQTKPVDTTTFDILVESIMDKNERLYVELGKK